MGDPISIEELRRRRALRARFEQLRAKIKLGVVNDWETAMRLAARDLLDTGGPRAPGHVPSTSVVQAVWLPAEPLDRERGPAKGVIEDPEALTPFFPDKEQDY